jgi:DNA replication protein DnaC
MRRYERASTLLTSNRPVEDWGKLLGDALRSVLGTIRAMVAGSIESVTQ